MLPILALGMASLRPALGDTLVDYAQSSSYVTADTSFSRLATATGASPNWTFTNAFSDTTVLSPTSGYTGPAFYGGYQYTITNDPNTKNIPEPTRQQIRNDLTTGTVTYDPIYLQDSSSATGNWEGATFSFHAVLVFKLAAPAALSDLSALLSNSSTDTDFQSGATWRWVVQSGGNYYVSQDTFTNSSGTMTLKILSTPSSELWASYNPSVSLDFDQASATYAAIDLSKITAAGLYLEDDSWAGSSATQALNAAIGSFTVDGVTAAPEPSSAALLLIGTLLLAGMGKGLPGFFKNMPLGVR